MASHCFLSLRYHSQLRLTVAHTQSTLRYIILPQQKQQTCSLCPQQAQQQCSAYEDQLQAKLEEIAAAVSQAEGIASQMDQVCNFVTSLRGWHTCDNSASTPCCPKPFLQFNAGCMQYAFKA